MAIADKYRAESGALIIICDDAYKDNTPEENKAAIRRFEMTASDCLYQDALKTAQDRART